MFLETRGDWCILLFHTHTQLFSLKITGVEEIFINATTLDRVGCVWGRCEADPRRASGASWRGTDKGPNNRSAMAEAEAGGGKALCHVQFLEKVLNPTDEQRPWILLLDCASVHTASAFRQQLHSQLPWVKSIYIPGGSTAYNQPLDRSMMKSFKSAIARKASRHFAQQILLVDSLDLSARFLKPVIATWVHEVINDISSRRDIFQTAWAHILPKNLAEATSVLRAAGEAHAAGSLFRSSKAGVVPETAPVDDEPEQPPIPEDEPELGGLLMDEEEPAPQDPLTLAPLEQPPTSPCSGAPQLVGAGAVHRARASVRQGLFLNSAHHTMSRRRSTFQLFACHHKHVSIFFMPPQSRVEDASREFSNCVCSQRLPSENKIFPDVCISCFVVLVFDNSLADCRSLHCVCALSDHLRLSRCACQVLQERYDSFSTLREIKVFTALAPVFTGRQVSW